MAKLFASEVAMEIALNAVRIHAATVLHRIRRERYFATHR